jgi:XTP/dITP diphosphohydrolase
MKILLATNNQHKRIEIDGILSQLPVAWQVVQPRELGFSFDTSEDGDTFGANAMQKARALGMLIRGIQLPGVSTDSQSQTIQEIMNNSFPKGLPPVLADDSGVCVHALDNRPGVFSARYGNRPGKPPASDAERNELLLSELGDTGNRGAHYVCHGVLWLDEYNFFQAQHPWYGSITSEIVPGNTGFGYDPLFYMEEYQCTVSQMSQEVKDRVSHRAKVIASLTRLAGDLT